MLARAAQELPLELGNLWPRRDYVHVDDVARAILALVELLDPSASPATMVPFLPVACFSVNVCTGVGTSVSRLAELMGRASGRRLSIVEVESRRRRDDGHLVGSSDLLTSLTGWKPRRELIDGVDDLVRRGSSPREHVHDIRLQTF
jgi:UDP-glucose 4-epimerase